MESAFGIDHGYGGDYEEIEKVNPLGALKPLGSAFKMGAQGMHGPMATAGQGRAMAAGATTRKIGQFGMRNKKPLAIGAGVGGGAVAGGSMLNRRR